MRTIFINGKFTAQRTTGVQRFALCIVEALDRMLRVDNAAKWVLLCPPGAAMPELRHIECRLVGSRARSLHAWEQFQLPWAARSGLLLNLAGSAPLLKRCQVCTFHDAAVFDFPRAHTSAFVAWYRFLFRRVARSATLLLTVSAFARDRLVAATHIAPERVVVLQESGEHLGRVVADAGILQRLGLRQERYFVAVGSANPLKNFDALLEAFSSVPVGLDVKLVIVGGTNSRVFSAPNLCLVDHRLVRAGAISDAELKSLYESAICLVFPSLYEGFGLPPLEAMACGCPVAASSAASLPEVCGDAALYFDPRSVEAMAAAMMRLHDEPALRERLRSAGLRRAASFGWDAAACVLLDRVVPIAESAA